MDALERSRKSPGQPSKPAGDPRTAAIRRLFALHDALAAGGRPRGPAGPAAKRPQQ